MVDSAGEGMRHLRIDEVSICPARSRCTPGVATTNNVAPFRRSAAADRHAGHPLTGKVTSGLGMVGLVGSVAFDCRRHAAVERKTRRVRRVRSEASPRR